MLLDHVVHEEPLTPPVSPGEIVAGKYRVERLLGVGGMGVVVSARHTTLDQVVAIKFLVANRFDTQEEAVLRFLDEARVSARIESDFVCRVFDVGTLPSGVPFMVMEYLEGRDLDEEIAQRGQLSVVEAVDYVLQAADALAAAHQLGIVHRDIKPANLFLAVRPDGSRRVKVLDFGISKVHDAPHRAPVGPTTRASLGTPAYMSPEQVRGDEHVDARADIWGLGAILYELVTGQMAFGGDDVQAVLDHVMKDDPCPMTSLRRSVPSELESIVMRCLVREQDERWASAATFARALAPFGSIGIIAQLASVQRELGSSPSLLIRHTPAHSVQPMIANVRPTVATEPDPDELLARESIVANWSNHQSRKRKTRVVALGVGLIALLSVAAALAIRMRAHRDDAELQPSAAVEAPAAAESVLPGAIAISATGATTATDVADAAAPSVYPATTSVQSARVSGSRPTSTGRPPARPAPKGSVNHLLDTRD